MRQAAQHPRAREPFEVRARLAAPLAEALDLPDPEALAYKAVQRDAPHDEVPPRLDGLQFDAAGGQVLQGLGLYQGEIVAASLRVGESPGPALVAVAPQPAARDSHRRGRDRPGAFGLCGERDQLDHA